LYPEPLPSVLVFFTAAEKRKQLTKSERPLPRGNEFTPELLEPCQSREMDDVMRHARENNLRGHYVEEA